MHEQLQRIEEAVGELLQHAKKPQPQRLDIHFVDIDKIIAAFKASFFTPEERGVFQRLVDQLEKLGKPD